MNQKIIITRGLPASGKTHWSLNYIEDNSNTIRVNRDDIRVMLTPKFQHGSKMEDLVTAIEDRSIIAAISKGYDVIVDATNFRGVEKFKNIISAHDHQIDLEIKDFTDISIEECIRRDNLRNNHVGEIVIKRMAKQYLNYKEDV
jgi:predicted kinase